MTAFTLSINTLGSILKKEEGNDFVPFDSFYTRPKVIKEDEISQNYCESPYFCTMSKLIFYGIMVYFLYKLIFNVVVPVSNGVNTMRQNMEQAKAAEANRQAAANAKFNQNAAQTHKADGPPVEAEYIDFEEVKKK